MRNAIVVVTCWMLGGCVVDEAGGVPARVEASDGFHGTPASHADPAVASASCTADGCACTRDDECCSGGCLDAICVPTDDKPWRGTPGSALACQVE